MVVVRKRLPLRYTPRSVGTHDAVDQRIRLVATLAERDGGRVCFYCGADEPRLQVDHVVPRAFGGSDWICNLVLACQPCNVRKRQKPAWAFVVSLWAAVPSVADRWVSARETPAYRAVT